ncbi:MAG: hypothetical protein PHU14_10220 [Methylovulum sp.]|nr:hypothetical protein [Methylovulum sp.]
MTICTVFALLILPYKVGQWLISENVVPISTLQKPTGTKKGS